MAQGDHNDPLRRGIMIGVFAFASLAMVGIFFSRPPVPSLLVISTGSVRSVAPAGDSLDFVLNGRPYPFHYSFECGEANKVAAALENAQRSGAFVRVQYRDPATQHKNLGLAYDVYAVSVPGQFERSYEQCRTHWIADRQSSVLLAVAFLAAFGLFVLVSRAFGKR